MLRGFHVVAVVVGQNIGSECGITASVGCDDPHDVVAIAEDALGVPR